MDLLTFWWITRFDGVRVLRSRSHGTFQKVGFILGHGKFSDYFFNFQRPSFRFGV